MTTRLAINGFGRIGRNILRALHESGNTDMEVVAINDLAPTENLAHLLKYDSVHGRFPGTVTHTDKSIDIGNGPIEVTAIRNLADQNWADNKVDIVLECTGIFTVREKAAAHLSLSLTALAQQTASRRWQKSFTIHSVSAKAL